MPTASPDAPDPAPDLLQRALAGDEAAFGRLMQAHYEHVFRLVHGILRNEHDARDVCQEVWLTVWKNLAGFRGDAKFTTWVHPIATRKAIDHLRKRRRWYDRFLPISADPEETGTVAEPAVEETARDELDRAERKDRFEAALAALPPIHRTVLALREVQGLAYDEIARAVKIPTGTVMSRLYHARRLLAQKLKELP